MTVNGEANFGGLGAAYDAVATSVAEMTMDRVYRSIVDVGERGEGIREETYVGQPATVQVI